ncbi:MAG: hypothetical protein AB7G11_07270 [Phycisphaerales bacterium]
MILVTGLCAPWALGQAQPALKGPEVKDRNVPGVVGDFGGGNGQRRFAERMPPEVFRKALGVLTADDAPEAIRASDTQRELFKSQVEDFEKQVREYRREHGKEIGELRKLAGELPGRDARRPGDRAEKQDDMAPNMSPEDEKKRDEARAKLRQIMESAPKIEDVYTKVWAGLNEAQRHAVDAEVAKFREQQAKQREDQYVRQRVKRAEQEDQAKRPAGAGDEEMMKPGEAAKPGDRATDRAPERALSRLTPERRERLLRVLGQMTPEELDQLIERLEARLKERGAARPEAKPLRNRKPAPNPDDVQVPEPTDVKK